VDFNQTLPQGGKEPALYMEDVSIDNKKPTIYFASAFPESQK